MVKNFVFSYGSLIFQTKNPRLMILNGYQRSWEVRIWEDRNTGLGISKKAGASCKGILFEASEEKLSELDIRETGSYKRIRLDRKNLIASNKSESIPSGTYWTYVTKKPLKPNKEYPIIKSYLVVVLLGFLKLGKGFSEEFIETTDNWSYLEDDLKNPRYPRALKKLSRLDELNLLIAKALK